MRAVEWLVRLPDESLPATGLPACPPEPDEPVELAGLSASEGRIESVVLPAGSSLSNLTLRDVDIAGLTAVSARAERVLLSRCRLRGVTWSGGSLQDATVADVTALDSSLRFSVLRRVTFRNCLLPGIDFTETVFDRVLMDGCQLRGARFDHATVQSLRVQGCDLSDVTGTGSLAGASVHPDDLISLGPSLASALGVVVE